MSEEVVIYQLAIFLIIVVASTLIGKRGMQIAVGCATAWTLYLVFTRWLFILQFGTILTAMLCGYLIFSKENFPTIRSGLWLLLGAAAIAGFVFQDEIKAMFETAPVAFQQDSPAPVAASESPSVFRGIDPLRPPDFLDSSAPVATAIIPSHSQGVNVEALPEKINPIVAECMRADGSVGPAPCKKGEQLWLHNLGRGKLGQ